MIWLDDPTRDKCESVEEDLRHQHEWRNDALSDGFFTIYGDDIPLTKEQCRRITAARQKQRDTADL